MMFISKENETGVTLKDFKGLLFRTTLFLKIEENHTFTGDTKFWWKVLQLLWDPYGRNSHLN